MIVCENSAFPNGQIGLIVMENMKEFGNKVDKLLKRYFKIDDEEFSFIINITESRFSNGEAKVTINETVRGKDIFILSDIGNYGIEFKMYGHMNRMTPDDHFQDIKRVISAINGKASRINVVMPLLYQSRQHQRKSRESLDCAMALQELQAMKIDGIYSFDVHDPNVQNSIPLLTFENIYPTAEIVNTILEDLNIADQPIGKDHFIIISPDTGAMDRAIYYSNILEQDIGLFYKRRDYSQVIDGKNKIVEHKYIGRAVEDHDMIIVDDMIASGGSIFDIIDQLKPKKVNNIYCAVSFALFTEGPEKFDEYYEKGLLKKVYSTNLSYVPEYIKQRPWFVQADLSDLMATLISKVNTEDSLSELLDKTRGIKRLKK